MGVGLALGHLAPGPRLEELVAVLLDGGVAELLGGRRGACRAARSWWSRMSSARPARSWNGWPWAGSARRDAVEAGDLVEALEELVERVGAGDEAGDVRRDRGQHVVAGEHDAVGGVEQAEVVVGVARRVERRPTRGWPRVTTSASSTRRVGAGVRTKRLSATPEELHLHPPLQRRAEHLVGAPRHRPAERRRGRGAVAAPRRRRAPPPPAGRTRCGSCGG